MRKRKEPCIRRWLIFAASGALPLPPPPRPVPPRQIGGAQHLHPPPAPPETSPVLPCHLLGAEQPPRSAAPRASSRSPPGRAVFKKLRRSSKLRRAPLRSPQRLFGVRKKPSGRLVVDPSSRMACHLGRRDRGCPLDASRIAKGEKSAIAVKNWREEAMGTSRWRSQGRSSWSAGSCREL